MSRTSATSTGKEMKSSERRANLKARFLFSDRSSSESMEFCFRRMKKTDS